MHSENPNQEYQLKASSRIFSGSKFKEAWQATAYVVTVKLSEAGFFTWDEWTNALSKKLRSNIYGENELTATDDHYYDHWQSALEQLLIDKAVVTNAQLDERARQWHSAYERTPHGEPVHLERHSVQWR